MAMTVASTGRFCVMVGLARRAARGVEHDLAHAGADRVGAHHAGARRLAVEVAGLDDEELQATELGILARRHHGADDHTHLHGSARPRLLALARLLLAASAG